LPESILAHNVLLTRDSPGDFDRSWRSFGGNRIRGRGATRKSGLVAGGLDVFALERSFRASSRKLGLDTIAGHDFAVQRLEGKVHRFGSDTHECIAVPNSDVCDGLC